MPYSSLVLSSLVGGQAAEGHSLHFVFIPAALNRPLGGGDVPPVLAHALLPHGDSLPHSRPREGWVETPLSAALALPTPPRSDRTD